jgi:hypothetical protein
MKKLTEEQKSRIAELDSFYAARIAEKEITLNEQAAAADVSGDLENAAKLREELAAEKKRLQEELEKKKEEIRADPGA